MKSLFSTVSVGQPTVTERTGAAPDFAARNHWAEPSQFDVRLRRARLGLIIGLIGILMIFISFTSAYVVRQGLPTLDPRTNTLVQDWSSLRLPTLLFWNTLVLLLSSATMEMARRQLVRDAERARNDSSGGVSLNVNAEWLAITALFGLCFLAGQWRVWQQLSDHGFYVSTNPSSSFFYLLTGTHGVHLAGGVLALLAACIVSVLRRSVETRAVMVDIAGWYWHFMAILWVYILCLLEFAR